MSKRSYQYRKRIRLPIISMLSKCSANFNATCKSFHKPISRINAQSAYKTHKAAPKQVSPKLQRALVTEVFKFPKSPWSTASSSSQHLARTRCRVSTRKASTSCKLTNWVQGFLPLHRNVARGSLTQQLRRGIGFQPCTQWPAITKVRAMRGQNSLVYIFFSTLTISYYPSSRKSINATFRLGLYIFLVIVT